MQLAYTRIRCVMTPAHTQSWPAPPPPKTQRLSAHDPTNHDHRGRAGSLMPQRRRGMGGHVKRRALGRFLRPHGRVGRDADPIPSIDYTTIYSLVFRLGDLSRGGFPTPAESCRASPVHDAALQDESSTCVPSGFLPACLGVVAIGTCCVKPWFCLWLGQCLAFVLLQRL